MTRIAAWCLTLAAASSALAAPVLAADMPGRYPTVVPYNREGPVEFGSTWYLRGDIGMAIYSDPSLSYSGPNPLAYAPARAKLDKTWTAGFGIGARLGQWFRSDVTFDYHMATDYNAGGTDACGGAGTSCAVRATADFSTYTLLLNGYVDLPGFKAITPYVGVGIGGSFVDWTDYTEIETCVSGCAGSARTAYSTEDAWRLAYAAMVGAAIDVSPNVKIDAGYRLLGIGNGPINDALPGGGSVDYKSLFAHELRFGLRYEIE